MKEFKLQMGLQVKDAFEGWFVKVHDKKKDLLFSVIIGYATGDDPHGFIQFQESTSHDTIYERFSLEEIKVRNYPFVFELGNNRLSEKALRINLEEVKLGIKFNDVTPLKKSFLKPNIMGFLSHLPNECNHAIISMDHQVEGHLNLFGQAYTFTNAKGYIEKDWGTSFPKAYVWAQANPWKESSVVFSYATVPMLGKSATGFFLVVYHQGEEHRFSSIEGAKMLEHHVTPKGFSCTIRKKKYLVYLEFEQHNPVSLKSPNAGSMDGFIKESLDGSLIFRMKKEEHLLINLETEKASIDIHMEPTD